MTEREREQLIEEAMGAFRPADPGGAVRPHPAWCDLSEADRLRAFDETFRLRALEAALDPGGLSTTVHSVLARIQPAR